MGTNTNSKFQISNSNRKIFLIGMPAVGKTYWGTKVAEHYGLPFADLDAFIEDKEQMSITALFTRYGEEGFRTRESNYLQQLISPAQAGTIIACGGGTPCFNNNMEAMKAAGCIVYLQADITTLIDHISNSAGTRPLLNEQDDLAGSLYDLLYQRKSFYEQADHILQTKDISLITFDKIITSCINRQ